MYMLKSLNILDFFQLMFIKKHYCCKHAMCRLRSQQMIINFIYIDILNQIIKDFIEKFFIVFILCENTRYVAAKT
jgi:hypothetical protein